MLLGFMLELVDESSQEVVSIEAMAEKLVISGMESVDVDPGLAVGTNWVNVVGSIVAFYDFGILCFQNNDDSVIVIV